MTDRLSPRQTRRNSLEALFSAFDHDGNGTIDAQEFAAVPSSALLAASCAAAPSSPSATAVCVLANSAAVSCASVTASDTAVAPGAAVDVHAQEFAASQCTDLLCRTFHCVLSRGSLAPPLQCASLTITPSDLAQHTAVTSSLHC